MWHDISTAPRDGTHILAYPVLLDVACVVSWHGNWHKGYWRLPMTEKATPYTPSMWMPIPKPETAKAEPRRDIVQDGLGRRDILKNPNT